jgi:flagellar basal body-associated protein FliL
LFASAHKKKIYIFLVRQRSQEENMKTLNKKTILILLTIIIIVAAFFRFYKLTEIPPGLYPDVAINGTDALEALKTGDFQTFYPENNGREGLFINLIALSFYFFGASVWAIKIVPAIIGLFTVLGLYLMTKELFASTTCHSRESGNPECKDNIDSRFRGNDNKWGKIIALLASFFLSISFWHVNFSRLGFRAIMVPFILVWSFYFLFRGIQLAKISFFNKENINIFQKPLAICYLLLSGLSFGLGFHTYISFRVAPAILGIAFIIEAYNFWQCRKASHSSSSETQQIEKFAPSNSSRQARTIILPWLLIFITIIIAALPMAIYFYQNPQDFMSRTGQVSVLASPQPIKGLIISTAKSLGMFNFSGDCNWRHNYACEPALPLPIGILFLFGFFRCLGEIFRTIYKWRNHGVPNKPKSNSWSFAQISIFFIGWFFIMLLPEILTNEGLPHSLRAIGAIPAVYVFAGIGGWWAIQEFKILNRTSSSQTTVKFKIEGRYLKILKILIIIFFIWLLIYSYDLYFIRWGKNPETKGAFTQNLVNIGNYLNSLPENFGKYVIVNANGIPVPYPYGVPIPAQTISFIEKTKNSNPGTVYILPDEIKFFENNIQKTSRPIIFTLINYDESVFSALKIKFPFGNAKNENNIWTFQINSNN